MNNLIHNNKIYTPYEYKTEKEFEQEIVHNSKSIFGDKTIYIDVKKKLVNDNIVTIPDGYLIDCSFEKDPRLYIIENELAKHDPYKHIGEQLLKFAISYKTSGRKIKSFLLEHITKDKQKEEFISSFLTKAGLRNIDAMLEEIIFEKPVAAIVIIDQITSDLENVLKQLTMNIDLLEFQTFINGDERIHKYEPFQEELRSIAESKSSTLTIEDLDTIVVPARPDGFEKVFLGQNCWYAIRISSSMINRIKYIAGYQANPVSAITHYAEVDRIEKYQDGIKYIVYFKGSATKINPIELGKRAKGVAPQAPRYTNFKKLLKAKTLPEVF
ncbi:MAG: hypothetical protein PVF17_04955 [Ignavibacteria bacterium]|jgi:hypothetical protein